MKRSKMRGGVGIDIGAGVAHFAADGGRCRGAAGEVHAPAFVPEGRRGRGDRSAWRRGRQNVFPHELAGFDRWETEDVAGEFEPEVGRLRGEADVLGGVGREIRAPPPRLTIMPGRLVLAVDLVAWRIRKIWHCDWVIREFQEKHRGVAELPK